MSQADERAESAAGILHVVATPIGNLGDITRRAVDVLAGVALIAAEDTRRLRTLLAALELEAREVLALHEHNEAAGSARVLAALEAGDDVALVSDAGTPLISDPGFPLIRECFERGLPVVPVPGPSALAAALSVCPLPLVDVKFLGFLPAKAAQRRERIRTAAADGPVVFFEAPHRVAACLEDVARVAPGRRVFIGREMTKRYESYRCGEPAALAATLEQEGALRGEFVAVLEGPVEATAAADVRRVMAVLCGELAPAQAARIGSELLNVPRRELYELAVSLRDRTQ